MTICWFALASSWRRQAAACRDPDRQCKVFKRRGRSCDRSPTQGLVVFPTWERLFSRSCDCAFAGGEHLRDDERRTLAGARWGCAGFRFCGSAPSCKFLYPVDKLGFLPQPSDPARMARWIGPSRRKLILMGARKSTLTKAADISLGGSHCRRRCVG